MRRSWVLWRRLLTGLAAGGLLLALGCGPKPAETTKPGPTNTTAPNDRTEPGTQPKPPRADTG